MWPHKLGIGSLSKAASSRVDKFLACFIDGTALTIELEPEFFDAVLRLRSRESKRKFSSGFVSQKYPSICFDILVTWFMVTLDSIICKSDKFWISLTWPGENGAIFIVAGETEFNKLLGNCDLFIIELRFGELNELSGQILPTLLSQHGQRQRRNQFV